MQGLSNPYIFFRFEQISCKLYTSLHLCKVYTISCQVRHILFLQILPYLPQTYTFPVPFSCWFILLSHSYRPLGLQDFTSSCNVYAILAYLPDTCIVRVRMRVLGTIVPSTRYLVTWYVRINRFNALLPTLQVGKNCLPANRPPLMRVCGPRRHFLPTSLGNFFPLSAPGQVRGSMSIWALSPCLAWLNKLN